MPHFTLHPLLSGLLLALLATLLPLRTSAAAPDVALDGAWTSGSSTVIPAPDTPLRRFDTRILAHVPRAAPGTWVRLAPAGGVWPGGDWVLLIEHPGWGGVRLRRPGHPVQMQSLADRRGALPGAPDALAFRLDNLSGNAPLWLNFSPTTWPGKAVRFALQTPRAWARQSANRLAFDTAVFSVLAVGGLMALWFGLLLRDRAYLTYALYVLGYAMLNAVSNGYAFHPLHLDWASADPARVARVSGGLAGMASILFASRFADLHRFVPWSRLPLRVLVGLFAAIVLLSLAPLAPLRALGGWLQNPVVVLAGASMLALLLLAWWRGSRYAGFMLLGWTPLVVLTVCASLQAFNLLLTWTWLDRLALAAAAFEALVLIAGLADRTLAARNDHRQALRMAEIDALTGTFNRGALLARLRQLMEPGASTVLSVLFIDLDHFKRLNDQAGHQAGDQALAALVRTLRLELRGADLLGRYGGEEFMVLLPGQSLSQALSVAERLLETVRRKRLTARADLPPLTISIGAAEARPGETLAQLLERADQAMYTAKRNGRDQVQVELQTAARASA